MVKGDDNKMSESVIDIAIVGAGAAGLSAAVNALARGKRVRVFSNKTNYLARAERVDNYLGFYDLNGQDLMNSFRNHAETMGIKIETGKVVNVLPFDDQFMVNFNGDIIMAKTVIIAVGVAKMKPIIGEQELLGKGVSYCATCDGMLYRGKNVTVCGQADDIIDETNFLQKIGVNVMYIAPHRPPNGLLADQVQFVEGTVKEIIGEQAVRAVKVNTEELSTEAVFILRNAVAPNNLVEGLELENGFVAVNRHMETNIPGIFACGDCVGAPLQVAKAVGEGLIAAQRAAKYIDEQNKQD